MKKSLLDIQQELRDLEKKVNTVSNVISEIYEDIDILRNDVDYTIDYSKIKLFSNSVPFENHPLSKLADKKICQSYLEILLYLVHLDKNIEYTIRRLVFVQWILKQVKLDYSLEELYIGSLKRNYDNLTIIVENASNEYKNQLALDALLLANICGKSNSDILVFVVDLCNFLGFTKVKLRIFSIIAKCVLEQDTTKVESADFNQVLLFVAQFRHYLSGNVIKNGIAGQRLLVVEVADKDVSDFRWKVKNLEWVKEGTVIADYYFYGSKDCPHKIIKAPCGGTIYQFRANKTNFGVLAHEKDDKDAVKAWTLLRR